MGVIKVAIADDHKIFRKGVILSLRPYPNIKFVLEADNGQELIDKLPGEEAPDVILMDLRMPQKDGIEATKYVARHFPQIHVICLTMFEDERFVSHMMEVGANGYLLKSAEPQEIKRAIMEVMAKGYYLNNFVNRILLKKIAFQAENRSQPHPRNHHQRARTRCNQVYLYGIYRPGNSPKAGSKPTYRGSHQRQADGTLWRQEHRGTGVFCGEEQLN